LIKELKPDYIFHLAANSTTSHEAIFENHKSIATGSINIMESVKRNNILSKIFLSGSCLQFVNKGIPIKETDPFVANDIYSAERIYTVYAARYFRLLGLKTYIGYFFHHDSPFRPERHLNMSIVKAAKRIKYGSKELIEIGNPDIIKEYNHAYDIMKAIWILVNQEKVYETVVGCGIGYSINDWIDTCFRILGMSSNGHIRRKDNFKSDFSIMVSCPEKLKELGWRPDYNIEDLAKEMIST
jgi:GDPmannose 4,6-dehydratase